MNPLSSSIQALHDFDPAQNKYLYVVGEGADMHLQSCKIGFLGRIWQWICIKLGCSNASMAKVAAYVAQNAAQLFPSLRVPDIRLLFDKFEKYRNNHPGTIDEDLKTIYACQPKAFVHPHSLTAWNAFQNYRSTSQPQDLEAVFSDQTGDEAFETIVPLLTEDDLKSLGVDFRMQLNWGSDNSPHKGVDFMSADQFEALFKDPLLLYLNKDLDIGIKLTEIAQLALSKNNRELVDWIWEAILDPSTGRFNVHERLNMIFNRVTFFVLLRRPDAAFKDAAAFLAASCIDYLANQPTGVQQATKILFDKNQTLIGLLAQHPAQKAIYDSF